MAYQSEIPIENIYYLLCYAWNTLDEKEQTDVGRIDSTELVDLFAKVLINGLRLLRKKGMDRGYVSFAESSNVIRGKINFNESLKKTLLKQARAYCEFDIFNYNVIHNRLIKSTISYLIKMEKLDKELKNDLSEIYFWFVDIDHIIPNSSNFSRVKTNRNNSFYKFMLNICRLIMNSIILDEKTGETKFIDFYRDIRKMRKLFELFICNFYKMEQTIYSVNKLKEIEWYGQGLDDKSNEHTPKMTTDISLFSPEEIIIIDTKFTPNMFQKSTYGDKSKIRVGHLYQIYAYVMNAEHKWKKDYKNRKPIKGVLLYPTVENDIRLRYVFSDHSIELRTINLAQPWKNIHNDLLEIIGVDEKIDI